MNNWMTLEEFKKEAINANFFGWCWLNYDGCSVMSYYLCDDFYFNDNTQEDETWSKRFILHVMPIQRPLVPK